MYGKPIGPSLYSISPWIFQTMNYVGSNNLSLKYQKFTLLGCNDIGFRKFKFVAKTQFFYIYVFTFLSSDAF